MDRLTRILYASLAHDRTQRALRRAVALAADAGAELTVAEVVPPGSRPLPADELTESLLFEARLDGLRVVRRLLFGDPRVAVAREAARGRYDLLVAATERPTGLAAVVGRYPALDVARAAGVSTWLLPRDAPRRPGVVVAALALSGEEDEARALDARVLAAAAAVARRERARLLVAHASRASDPRRVEALLAAHPELASGRVVAELRLERGRPAVAIPRLLRREGATVLVAGASGGPGARAAFGGTMERLAHRFDGSVLAVHARPVAVPLPAPAVARPATVEEVVESAGRVPALLLG